MEVTALCSRLLMTVLLLLVAQVHINCSQNEDFPQVSPNRQQHFKFESINVSCEGLEGLTGWRVMRRIKGVDKPCAASWSSSTGPCKITDTFPEPDSGEYWCERVRKKSNTINITVTDGPVILESPVLPVMEGNTVTLSCRDKRTSSNITVDFYKDGHIIKNSSTGDLTIHSVSKYNEGLYKCRISDVGKSAESWLTVREIINVTTTPAAADGESDPPPSQLPLLLSVSLTVVVVAVLLLVGLLQLRKHQPVNRVSREANATSAAPTETTYAVVGYKKPK